MKNLVLDNFYKLVGNSKKDQVRVLIFHDIEKKNFEKFEKLLNYLIKNFSIITPEEFKIFSNHNLSKFGNKKKILITFDDGYKSQKQITEKYLNPKNIKAIFFLVSDFISIKSKIQAQAFVRNNFYKNKSSVNLDNDIENMNIQDINFLIESGHTLGAHTKTHLQLSNIKNENELTSEILDCKKKLEELFKKTVIDDFAYTFGDYESINEKSLNIISKYYKFIYSGLRGNNLKIKNNVVRRDAINMWETTNVINCYLNGYLDFIYEKKVKNLENWIKT
tara:strand:+ start:315 stop:1148 length:834 start_codon:yes stop_codon:yes gene_type:complete